METSDVQADPGNGDPAMEPHVMPPQPDSDVYADGTPPRGYLVSLGDRRLDGGDAIGGTPEDFASDRVLGPGTWTWSGTDADGQPVAGTGAGTYHLATTGDVYFVPDAEPPVPVASAAASEVPAYDGATFGTAGDDSLGGLGSATAGDDLIYGGADRSGLGTGHDAIDAGAGHDAAFGGDGNDTLTGGDGDDRLEGGEGNDVAYGGAGSDTLEGGAGDDTLVYGTGSTAGGDTVYGGDGHDRIDDDLSAINPTGNDAIYGGEGNDAVWSGGGDDVVYGGSGDDQLSGEGDHDALYGGAGSDTLDGGAGSDTLDGGEGSDRLFYGTGGDTVYGGEGNDLIDDDPSTVIPTGNDALYGGGGNDTVWSGGGDDVVYGGAGDDQLGGETGHDTIWGDDGHDRVRGQDGNDDLYGGAGNDRVDGGAGSDTLDGGLDDDQLFYGTGGDTVYGGEGHDWIDDDPSTINPTGDDVIYGGAGNDAVWSGGGNDSIFGGAGDDHLDGEGDHDTIWGDNGHDSLTGGSGNDGLYGGDDNDAIGGGEGDDKAYGDAGHDRISGGEGQDEVYGGAGDDQIGGDAGNDVLIGEDGRDSISGGDGNDIAYGGTGDDLIDSGVGNDQIGGDAGADSLFGDEGDDTLDGGAGNDVLIGGAGDDTVVTGSGADVVMLDVGGGHDVVTDFDLGDADGDGRTNDQIDVSWLTTADGTPIDARDVVVTDDGQGNAKLTFPGGETLVLQGVSPAQMSGLRAQVLQGANVNAAPVVGDGQQTGPEDATITGRVTATDLDGDALTYTLVQGALDASGNAVAGLTFDADGSYAFQGPRNFNGSVTFTYAASDGLATSSPATVTLAVTPVNDAPAAPTLADRSSPEDHAVSFQVPTFADMDGDAVSYGATLADGAPLPAWLAFDAATRSFSGTPPADRSGPLGLMVTASDGVTSASDTFTLTITPVNDAPVAATLPDHTSPEDGRVSFQVPAFADVDGDTLAYGATLADGAALPAWLAFDAATRTFSGTPPANWSGALDVRVKASDGPASASDTFRLAITPVNDGPVARDDRLSAIEDAALRIPVADLLGNDRDVDGDALTITGVSHAQGGTAVLRNGVVTFAPQANVSGPAFFDYVVRDGAGRTDVARVAVDVAPVNDAPVAASVPDRVFAEDHRVLFQVPAFADVDGNALSYAARLANGGALPSWLKFDAAARTFSGTPPAHWSGALDVTVSASDGQATASDTFRLSLTPVSDAPVAKADALGGPGRSPIHDGAVTRIDVTALVANDLDPDGGAVRFAGLAAGPGQGTLDTVTEGGRTYLVYEYAGAQLGAGATAGDAFTYRVVDASGATATATASLTVTGLSTRTMNGTTKPETLTGGDLHHDSIHAGKGNDVVHGGAGRDRLNGGKGADELHGDDGADRLHGKDGRDWLNGGEGNDRLSGGRGHDRLSGGAGADAFVFGQGSGQDRIADFELGVDDIRLGKGISVASASTGHLDSDHLLDTMLSLSNGGTIEVMDVSGLTTDQWVLIA